MFPKKKKVPYHKKYRLRTAGKKKSRLFDWALVILSIVVIVLVGSTTIRFVRGETKTLPPQIITLRTQIANGCGIDGAASNLAEWVKTQDDDYLKFDIIDVSNYTSSAIPETMILVRNPGVLHTADQLAENLGIDQENIVMHELDDNYLSLDITIVAGKNYKMFDDSPDQLTVDILNGCGLKGAAHKFSLMLRKNQPDQFVYDIQKNENFENFDVRESLLIVKSKKGQKYAQEVAKSLNIKKDNVILDNTKQIEATADLTIVIGQDWGRKLASN